MVGKGRSTAADAAAPRYPIESVANAARLLRLFGERAELRISDAAELLSISPSTAHRLLTTLEAAEMVRQNETTRCYEPGPGLLSVAYALTPSQSRWKFARPYMAELSERVGETVNLQSLQGTDVAFVESVDSTSSVRVGSRLGAVMPAHLVSGGKCLLALLPEEDLKLLYPDSVLPSGPAKGIATREELITELRRVKRPRLWNKLRGERARYQRHSRSSAVLWQARGRVRTRGLGAKRAAPAGPSAGTRGRASQDS